MIFDDLSPGPTILAARDHTNTFEFIPFAGVLSSASSGKAIGCGLRLRTRRPEPLSRVFCLDTVGAMAIMMAISFKRLEADGVPER